ncbi:MAG TPA: saccharopine dehydrogenase NADP-binding domain-containing protein [archaeon]|nr:saccharopine dehydrogenase NADP-binding domain-containing protein [archaeon]
MRILVLGGYGGMGSVAVRDLADSKVEEVMVAGRDIERAKAVVDQYTNASAVQMDAQDKNLADKIKLLKPDVIINAVQYQFNLLAMNAAIRAKVHYIDLGGLFHMTKKQLKLHEKAKHAGVLCLLGMGSTPGTTNVMGSYLARKFDRIEQVSIRSGWRIIQKLKKPVIPYSPNTILDEFLMPAPIFSNGKIKFVKPLNTKVVFEFQKPLGRVSGHYTIHSELATMPKNIGKGVKRVDFAVAYPSEFTNLVESIIKKYKKKEQQIEALKKATVTLSKDPVDIDGQRVEIFGFKSGKPLTERIDVITTYYKKWQRGSAIDTGVPPSIAAQWIAKGKIRSRGVLAPENVFKGLELAYFKELYKHTGGNMKIWEFVNERRKRLW